MLISQTFRGSAKLEKLGFELLQKWYMLTNEQKHEIIKTVLATGLNSPDKKGKDIKDELKAEINRKVSTRKINALKY